jgi:adenylate kinase family enzyme
MPQRDLLLITGIPGTGKTSYGNRFAKELSFVHVDLEDQQTLTALAYDPAQFIAQLKGYRRSVVVTWGFAPDEVQTAIVLQFRSAGFKWIWFDGNRPAALREFQKRGTVAKELFDLQMERIENSRIVERFQPAIINTFDQDGKFKPADRLLDEIRRA